VHSAPTQRLTFAEVSVREHHTHYGGHCKRSV
jgi:hypothetical protein